MAEEKLQRAGRRLVRVIEDTGLLVILLATLVAAAEEVVQMVTARSVHLADLLLLFIYLLNPYPFVPDQTQPVDSM